jgi:hypothetical protein
MRRIAIERAREKFDLARNHAAELRSTSKDYRTVRDNWTGFLIASNRVFTLLEQGSKSSPESVRWFAKHRELRKSDPLLSYLHQARNADEHGLAHITQKMTSRLELVARDQVVAELENLKSDKTGQLVGTYRPHAESAVRLQDVTELRIHPEQPVLAPVAIVT